MVVRSLVLLLLFAVSDVSTSTLAIGETVRFATVDFAPYALKAGGDERRGLIVEVNAAIAARTDVGIIDSVLPVARVVKNLQHDISDCAVLLLSPWSKEEFIPVAEVFDRFDSVVITRKGLPITRIKDLHGRNLALPRGSYVGFPIATDPEIRRFSTNGYAQSARLLKAGRVDAIAGTALSIYYHLSVMKMGRTDIGGILSFASKPVWLHCAKRQLSEKLVVRMRQATNSLRKEGAFRRMLDRYVPVGFR